MKEADCPWSKALVAVCTRCHGGIEAASLKQEGNSGENLKDFLKASLRTQGHAGAIRTVNTGCLGLCPVAAQAVAIQPHGKQGKMLVVHPEEDRAQLLDYLSSLV